MSQRLYATPPRGQSVSVNSALRRPAQICQALVAADNLAESTFAITRGAVLLASFTSTSMSTSSENCSIDPRVHQIYIAWTNRMYRLSLNGSIASLGQHAIATVELTSHTSARPKLCSSTTPCPDPALGSLNFIVSTTGLDEFWLTMLFFVHLHSIYQAALAERFVPPNLRTSSSAVSIGRMSDNFRGWLDWTSGNTSSPPVDQGQQDEAVRIFEAINENEPAWDITTHSSLPAWVTTDDLRRVWFSNTDYFLPFYGSLYPDYRDVILDTSTIEFLELLRRMVKPRPITVDVLVHEEGIFNRISLHRLLLVSYHLGGRSDLLNIRVIASTGSGRLDTNAKIADPLKVRLLQDCATMQKFRDGTMSLEQVFDEYEVPLTRSDIQALSPENAVARLLTGQTISAGIYSDFGLSNQSTAQLKQYCTELKAEANSRAEEEDDEEEDSDEASDEDKEFSGLNGKTTRQ
ncbi:hypothetical protein E4T38_02819 [Aureobasidium subglaciale]|nr:hypothetical protein E4T38_02819 [Aureobasidium subglaciale]KAI5227302.1 hypothetical protein E4T40_02741 [Aureobasidium subglaciale]KAI5230618.1 hypothetical protein E4T41_02818 [Aureobasidium subglaciale]KAI5264864.1 hypothetical protein E4T46_02596 [Aureobasidium subglaciale]